jgi:hypothetical protein
MIIEGLQLFDQQIEVMPLGKPIFFIMLKVHA